MFLKIEHEKQELPNGFLLTNRSGEHILLTKAQMKSFDNCEWDCLECLTELESRFFIALPQQLEWVNTHMVQRELVKKSYLVEPELLLMIVPTSRCNSSCLYCQVGSTEGDRRTNTMSMATANQFVDFVRRLPNHSIKIEFQGGEPTLEMSTIELIVVLLERLTTKTITFVICTNLLRIDNAFIQFVEKHHIDISTSIDGPRDVHNRNRPSKHFDDPWDVVSKNIAKLRQSGVYPAALMTLTGKSVTALDAILETYLKLDFSSVFIRPLNLYGRAARNPELHINPDIYVEQYKNALDFLLRLNLEGKVICDEYTAILLRKILTPFSDGFVDLQNPCAHGTMSLLVNYNGQLYPSDECRMLAEMGDNSWSIGRISEHDIDQKLGVAREKILKFELDEIATCKNCAFKYFCGADPVRLALFGTEKYCGSRKGVFEAVFSRLTTANENERKVLYSWAIK